jgi:2-oxo-hept-3-ene-1,7-dioate hydratase
MALPEGVTETLAERLDQAERNGKQIDQFGIEFPDMTLEDGYRVQRAWVKRKLVAGRSTIGHKIGLTSRAMQRASNIQEPDYGVLLDDMLFANNGDIPIAHFIEPRVEVELAFILRERRRACRWGRPPSSSNISTSALPISWCPWSTMQSRPGMS